MNGFTLCLPLKVVTEETLETINHYFYIAPAGSEVLVMITEGGNIGLLDAFGFLGESLKIIWTPKAVSGLAALTAAGELASNEHLVIARPGVVIPETSFEYLTGSTVGRIRVPELSIVPDPTPFGFISRLIYRKRKFAARQVLQKARCFGITRGDLLHPETLRSVEVDFGRQRVFERNLLWLRRMAKPIVAALTR